MTVIIDVPQDLLFHTSGIYDNPNCGTAPAHAVTVVGYDANSYIIKNSFGKGWASDGGFFRIARGKNMCGLANLASFPIA